MTNLHWECLRMFLRSEPRATKDFLFTESRPVKTEELDEEALTVKKHKTCCKIRPNVIIERQKLW